VVREATEGGGATFVLRLPAVARFTGERRITAARG
jgi:hypothetical protein